MSARAWVERAIVSKDKTHTTELYAYLPDDEHRARSWLRQVLGPRVRIARVQRHGVDAWKLSAKYLLPLAGAMAYAYGATKMRVEVLQGVERCDQKCQKARRTQVWECVCSCAGEYHGGRGSRNDWYPLGRSTLVRYEKTQIEQVILTADQLSALQIPALKKVPRPAPAPRVIAPRPLPLRPHPIAPPSRPAPVVAPVPRTVIPAASRFGDLARLPADVVPAPPSPRPAPPVSVPVRKLVAGPLIAAALMLVALSGGIWVITQSHLAAREVTNQETVDPQPSTVPEHLPPPPPAEEAPAPPPRFPAGCYPFQSGC